MGPSGVATGTLDSSKPVEIACARGYTAVPMTVSSVSVFLL